MNFLILYTGAEPPGILQSLQELVPRRGLVFTRCLEGTPAQAKQALQRIPWNVDSPPFSIVFYPTEESPNVSELSAVVARAAERDGASLFVLFASRPLDRRQRMNDLEETISAYAPKSFLIHRSPDKGLSFSNALISMTDSGLFGRYLWDSRTAGMIILQRGTRI